MRDKDIELAIAAAQKSADRVKMRKTLHFGHPDNRLQQHKKFPRRIYLHELEAKEHRERIDYMEELQEEEKLHGRGPLRDSSRPCHNINMYCGTLNGYKPRGPFDEFGDRPGLTCNDYPRTDPRKRMSKLHL
eukprot:388231-Rhodomonas_salina.1